MKKILITGANSYIGTSFENYLKQWPDEYQVDTVDMIDGSWRHKSFKGYNVVFHVAGIAHQKETKENAPLYYKVNRDFAIETAQKAKSDGVGQFVFLSSMSVYGMETGVITKDAVPNPKSHYGRSKLQAETEIIRLNDVNYKVAILRPPMVYGKGCKGNFQKIIKIVKKYPLFPLVNNSRSMIFIDNLCEYVKEIIDVSQSGYFFPQNQNYVNTSDMAEQISITIGKKIYMSRILGVCVAIGSLCFKTFKKAFGSLTYNFKDCPKERYIDFSDSIKKSI